MGVLSPSSTISNRPTFAFSGRVPLTFSMSGLAPIPTTEVFAGAAGLATSSASTPTSVPGQAMLLSSALPPIPANVVAKIKSGQYVPMKELLADNMSLCNQLETLPGTQLGYTGLPKPRLREVQSLLTWVSCWYMWQSLHLTPGPVTSSPMAASWAAPQWPKGGTSMTKSSASMRLWTLQ